MDAELWGKIDAVFRDAQARPPEERAEFLDRACAGDPRLRAEVDSLLRSADAGDSPLDHPPVIVSLEQPSLRPGDTLGSFQIVERIGRGGMGEVYRARDSRLRREVAIKVLPQGFARDAERLARFEREARAASALNHPNIVSVHDIGRADGMSWIVTELVEGRSLRDALGKGALAPRKALEIAEQIAEGLSAAHAAGLVHRDLKPENVMLTTHDRVKILDFGIAKWKAPKTAGASTRTLTREGELVGTVPCMSPEQVTGGDLDHRSDIFSLGALLYEMLAGKRPFSGDTDIAVMHAIVSGEPEELPATVPQPASTIVHRCLEKLPERRFQSAADLAFALRMAGGAQLHPRASRRMDRNKWPIAAVAMAALIAEGLGLFWLGRRTTPPQPPVHGAMHRLTWDEGLTTYGAISPDGRLVAYASDRGGAKNLDIYVQQIDGGGIVRLTNGPADHANPAFAPDATRVAFESFGETDGIYEVPALGGERRLLVAGGRRPRYSPDGRFLLYSAGWDTGIGVRFESGGPGTRLYAQPLAGGEPVPITPGCSSVNTGAIWSPDGRQILFSGTCTGRAGFWLAAPDGRFPRATNLAGSWRARGLSSGFNQWLASPARLLILLANGDGSHVATLPISEDGMEVTGSAQTLTFGWGAIASASASSDGRIVWSSVESSSNLWRLGIDAQGRAQGDPVAITTGKSACVQPVLSADGQKVAFVALHAAQGFARPSESDLLVMNLASGRITPVAHRHGWLGSPVFNGAGDRIVFNAGEAPGIETSEVNSRGGPEREILRGAQRVWDWSADGSFFLTGGPTPARWGVSLHRPGAKPVPILADAERDVYNARLSHDGRWVAFSSVQNRQRSQICIAPFRGEAVPVSEWITVTEGDKPRFSVDDRLVLFVSDRDGSRCIWRQRLTGDMHPQGVAEEVIHLHSPRVPFAGADNSFVELTVGRGELIFNQGETTGNIWMLDPREGPRK
jgi:Tol biopolymer transport system component